ncbi:MAG: type II toxin-antitoxin system ParD family antitoxin [Candidatus Latescibacteria bacterium]|nr:type II toxin-antitoxin system ParD family antitoxin [Candidatus Latescibacterota bacterium]
MTASMNISLPEALKKYVKERCAEGEFSNPSDYLRALIREDKKHREQEKLELLLLQGLGSGRPMEISEQYWKKKRSALAQRQKKTGT